MWAPDSPLTEDEAEEEQNARLGVTSTKAQLGAAENLTPQLHTLWCARVILDHVPSLHDLNPKDRITMLKVSDLKFLLQYHEKHAKWERFFDELEKHVELPVQYAWLFVAMCKIPPEDMDVDLKEYHYDDFVKGAPCVLPLADSGAELLYKLGIEDVARSPEKR